jgi:hypothetical protein
MSEPSFLAGGTGIESCYTATCTEGYIKPFGSSQWSSTLQQYTPSCSEKQIPCNTLKPVDKGSFYSPVYRLKQDDNNITVNELVSSNVGYHSVTPPGICPDVATVGQKIGSYYVTCKNGSLNLSPTPIINLKTGIATGSKDNLLFCCGTGTHHMVGLYDGVKVSGCCSLNEVLTANGSCASPCEVKPNQSFTRSIDGTCQYKCDAGYVAEATSLTT